MDRYLCRKDIYDQIEKAMRDKSHLTQKVITDKNGHQRKVWVRGSEDPKKQRTKKVEEPTEKKIAKPKYKQGDAVKLEGQNGVFYITKIDSDGSYHVQDKTETKGYHVSENHLSGGEKVEPKNMEMTDGLGKIRDAINELSEKAHNEKDIAKKTELNNQIRDIQMKGLQSNYFKKKDREEINFEKKNNASKTEDVARKNDAENNVNDAIKLSDAEKKEITDTFTSELLDQLKGEESTTIGNIILNNLYSTGKKDLFNKIRKQEWDYKDANNKHGKTFNSDYAKEAMYKLYQEYQKNGKESQKEDYSDWGNNSTNKKQLEPTYGRKQIPASEFSAAKYKEEYDDDKVDTTYDGIKEGLRQALELPIIKRHPEFMMKLRNDLMKAEKEPETVTKYRKSGEGAEAIYTPERTKIHKKIIDRLIAEKIDAAKPKNGEQPTFQILGGRGGSGKSTFNKKKSDAGVYNEDNVIVVDPDALKQELANESGDGWEGWKAKAYHEESSDVSKMLMKSAMALGLNVVMDITMSNADTQIDELKLAKSLGYKTGAYYMHVPKQESFKRAMKRYVESETEKGVEDFSGRLVPPDVLLGMTGNEANFDKVKEFADDWSFYDNFIPFEKDEKTQKNKYKAEKIAQKGE